MADVRISVDDRAFSASLRRYALAMKMSFAEAIIRQARLVAVNLAHQTQPFGKDKGAKTRGENTVSTEIGYVYDDVPEVSGKLAGYDRRVSNIPRVKTSRQAAAAFTRLIRSGQHSKAQRLLNDLRVSPYFSTDVGHFDGGSGHQASRFGARKKVPKNTFPKLAVVDAAQLKQYVKKIMQRVGMAKAGWASCAQQLGGFRDIPAWVTRHAVARPLGDVHDATGGDGKSQYVRMTNRVPWIDKCLNLGQIQRALDIQRGKMVNAIQIALSKAR